MGAGLAQRARIVLLAAEGMTNTAIARAGWGVPADGDRLAGPVPAKGLAGLADEDRSGAADDRPGAGGRGDVDAAAEEGTA